MAMAFAFTLAPSSSTAAAAASSIVASSRRVQQQQQQQQQSNSELIEMFNQVTSTNNSNSRIDDDDVVATLDEEEVVSGGTVYATCPDLSAVSGPLYTSDTNSDGFINQYEYVQFTDAISGGFLSENGWEGGFNDMPLALQETYLVLSCLCELYPGQSWGGVGCCKANDVSGTGIRTDGAMPGMTPNTDQLQYLTYVCGTMSESLESVGGSIVAASPPPTTTTTTSAPTTTTTTTTTMSVSPTMQPVMPVSRNRICHAKKYIIIIIYEKTFLMYKQR